MVLEEVRVVAAVSEEVHGFWQLVHPEGGRRSRLEVIGKAATSEGGRRALAREGRTMEVLNLTLKN